MNATMIGLDIAKTVFQAYGEDAERRPVLRKRPSRAAMARYFESAAALEAQLVARARADAAMRRLMTVPGIGPLTAQAIVAAIGDGRQFGSARDFAAWPA